MKRTHSLYAAAMIAISAAAFLPVQAMAQGAGINIVIGNAPPPPRFEAAPPPRHGFVWAPGYWNWDGQRHVWAAGHWEAGRNGAQYRRSEWVRDGERWRLNQGGWSEVQGQAAYDYVKIAPPPPRREAIPRPRAGYLWAPGHWEWRNNRHQWTPGVFVAQRPGYTYRPAAWAQRDGRWYMEQSRWDGRGDSDHDGIPNRVDRHDDRRGGGDKDHDGVPDRRDHDRDGDGVPNRNDARPDNPRRN